VSNQQVAERVTWRLKMRQQRELKSEGMLGLYKRVQLIAEIHRDHDYSDDCASRNVEPLDELDNEVSDTALSAATLMAVIEYFPHEDDWKKGNIQMMAAEVVESQHAPTAARPKKSWKEEALRLKAELERLQRALEIEHARVEELEKVINGRLSAA